MTQVRFAEILRVGKKNFERYENGQSTQGYAMDDLLRILDRYPAAIKVLGGEWPVADFAGRESPELESERPDHPGIPGKERARGAL